jgi:hypothetical protein
MQQFRAPHLKAVATTTVRQKQEIPGRMKRPGILS